MGDLITFSRASSSERLSRPVGETAEILFFTGVRYYRMPDAIEPTPVKRRRRRVERIKRVSETSCHA